MTSTSQADLRVVIAEDDVFMLAGIRELLLTVPGFEIVGTATTFDELLAAVGEDRPDVLVTDIRMPPSNTDEGVRASQELRVSHPRVGVVLLSQFVDPHLALAVVGDGAPGRGYLLKHKVHNVEQLVEAIRSVAAGGSYLDTDVVDALVQARSKRPGNDLADLTPRQLQVLAEMAAGRANQAIADHMFVGVAAIENHINAIFRSLGLASEDRETHRRVAAVLRYLTSQSGVGTSD